MDDRRVLRREDGTWVVHADLGHVVTGPINDMVVSRSGNAYVTGFGQPMDSTERVPTHVVMVRPDGTAHPQQGELYRPNGCVVTPDDRRLIVAETRVHRLSTFRISGDGTLHDQRVIAELPSGAWADGICLDQSGGMWVADPKGKRCFYVAADGELLEVIDTAPTPCIACTLGGADGRTLFLLLSDLPPFGPLRERRQARIDQLRVDVPSSGSP
jgi:sugar lactone lactonase YvrE